jgi:hypothetical protein
MKKAIFAVLLLTGCQTTEERIAADDTQCRSYGVAVGSQAYIQCRANLDTNRANIKASERFGNSGGMVGWIERQTDK